MLSYKQSNWFALVNKAALFQRLERELASDIACKQIISTIYSRDPVSREQK
jgi:hypothetical protein